jgi:sugar/nucleoside kinase (ribokinase family)
VSAPFVSVVGTVNHDRIVTADGRHLESLGGILYNAVPLAALLEGTGVRVRLHGRLGAEHRREAERLLAPFPLADASGLIADGAGTNASFLDYSGPGDRVERVELRVAPLSGEDLAGVAGAKAVLVNMVSGRDLSRETAARLRRACAARFFLDVQALTRTNDAPRRPRAVPDWREWCACFDVIRGNEVEICHFAGLPGDVAGAMRRILDAGADEVLVTRGEEGSLRAGRGRTEVEKLDAFPSAAGSEVTGCGDSFLAGVCAGWVLGLSGMRAASLGSWTAAQMADLAGLDAARALRGLRLRAARVFPELA